MTTLRKIQESPWTCTWIQALNAVVWVKRPEWSSDKQPQRKLWKESGYISLVHIDGADAETFFYIFVVDRLDREQEKALK